MNEIAREAGVGTGTLYNYFDSKELIFSALVERRGDELIARMEAASAEQNDPLLRITVTIRTILEYLEEHRALFLLFTQINGVDWGIARVKQAEERYQRCMALLGRAIRDAVAKKLMRRDIPVEQQALLVSGAIHGVVRAWLEAGGETPLARNTTLVLDFVMNGLGARR
jgi:AcrR family transcriptional regulator